MNIGWVSMEKATNRDENSVGSSRIRAKWVYKYWDEAEEWIIGKKYDALIFQKVYWEEMMKEYEGIKILDICDPDWLEGRYVVFFCDLANFVTTSTPALADYLGKLTKTPVECVPDRIDLEEHKTFKTEHKESIRDAVWFGYSHNANYLENVYDILYDHDISLTIYSESQITPRKTTKCDLRWKKYDYNTLHQELIQYDVAIMPERHDYRGHFKSNNKRLTCKALGIPIVEEPNDLIELANKQSRQESAKINRQDIEDNWDVRLSVKQYKDIIERCK